MLSMILCRTSSLVTFPMQLEGLLSESLERAELMIYTISPSHEIPATYPMISDPGVGAGE